MLNMKGKIFSEEEIHILMKKIAKCSDKKYNVKTNFYKGQLGISRIFVLIKKRGKK